MLGTFGRYQGLFFKISVLTRHKYVIQTKDDSFIYIKGNSKNLAQSPNSFFFPISRTGYIIIYFNNQCILGDIDNVMIKISN